MTKSIEDQIKEAFEEQNGWIKYNGIKLDEITKEKITASVQLQENLLNPHGIAHGGLIFGLADTTMGTLASLTGRKVVTIDSSISYLRPCAGDKIVCVAEPVKVGMTIGVYKANIYNSKDDLAATVTASYYFLDREIKKQ